MVRFSLDETFDVGEDTGTPVVEDYVDKMPFRFTGTLKRFAVVLEPVKLSDEEQDRLLEEEAQASPGCALIQLRAVKLLSPRKDQPEGSL